MQVILIHPVPKLGYPGDLVRVKPGYARNYLIPRGLAILATPKNLRHAEHLKAVASRRRQKFVKNLEELAQRLHGLKLVLEERTHNQGNLYGSVSARRLAQILSEKSGGIEVDPRWIRLEHPLKTTGTFVFELEPHAGVKAQIHLEIRSLNENLEEPTPPASPEGSPNL